MRHLKYYLFIVVLFSCLSQNLLPAEESSALVTVHNVGQGNCIDIALSATGKEKDTEYVLIDIGSSAYQKEWFFTSQQTASEIKNNFATPVKEKKDTGQNTSPPKSSVKESNYPETVKNFLKSDNRPFIKLMREKFEIKDTSGKKAKKKPTIKVKTVIITHPDADHYGWLMELFVNKNDHIDYLILAGLPENYYSSVQDKTTFKKWLEYRLNNGTKVFFPAIQSGPISKEQLDIKKSGILTAKPKDFMNHWYPELKEFSTDFQKAFEFGGTIKASLLSVNPTHFKGNSDIILRMSSPEDDNSDSLVLKIENGASSAILTGDATYLTTTRILDNYRTNLGFLKTNVLLASHHGSATHGSNSEEWIKATQPEYVLISNGHSQGHPQSDAYEMFKKSDRLKIVPKHQVLVGKTKDFKVGSLHETSNAVFSTLNSGTLTCNLLIDGTVKLSSKDKEINPPSQLIEKEDKVVEVDLQEEENKITATPTPKKEKKEAGIATKSISFPLLSDVSKEEEISSERSRSENSDDESSNFSHQSSSSIEEKENEISLKRSKPQMGAYQKKKQKVDAEKFSKDS